MNKCSIMQNHNIKMINYKEKLQPIKAFVFDFDGVLTDGNVWVFADRQAVRATNTKDGYAIHQAVKRGYTVAVISGGTSESIDYRMEMLGVSQCYTGRAQKIDTYNKFLADNGLRDEQVVYVGDDIPDCPVLKRAGVSVCPADAAVEVREMVDYVSPFNGGHGCARDIIEQVMRLHGEWFNEDAVIW